MTGTPNDWPFQYQGMEKEFADPAPYYYSGGGQFYSPQLVRSLSETGQTSSSGPGGGPSGNGIAAPSGGGGPDVARNAGVGSGAGGGAFLVTLGLIWGSDATTGGLVTVAAIVATVVDALVQGFLDLFGGGSSPQIPRQLRHGRHPLYPVMLGVSDGLITDEVSAGLKICGDPHPCNCLELPTPTATPTSPDLSEYLNNQGFETDEQMRQRLKSWGIYTTNEINDMIAHRFALPVQSTPYGYRGPLPTPVAPLQKQTPSP